MSTLSVGFSGYDTSRSASDSIWSSCPVEQLAFGKRAGAFIRDDFTTFAADASLYKQYADAAAIALEHDTGALYMNCTNTDNNESYVAGGINITAACKMTGGGLSRVWFETRLKLSAITDQGVFVGLALPTFAAANMLVDDTGVPRTTNGSFVGFRAVTADPDGMDAVYATAGTALTVHQEAEGSDAKYVPGTTSTYLQNLVADTYVKYGIYFDGLKCYWFVNGVKVNETGVAATATNFPDGVNMHVVWGVKTGESVAKAMTVDWYQIGYAINS